MDSRPLQPLSRVEGGNLHGVRRLVGSRPGLRSGPCDKAPGCARRVKGLELVGQAPEFSEGRPPLGIPTVFPIIIRAVADGAQVGYPVSQGAVAATESGQLRLHVGPVQQAAPSSGPDRDVSRLESGHQRLGLGVGAH